jgi:hypothetical protein
MRMTHVRVGLVCLLCVLGLTMYSWLCQDSLAQVPLPTSPSSANPGFCCQLQPTNCANLIPLDCHAASMKCGAPYNVDCVSEKVLFANPWGSCQFVDSSGNAKCTSFDPFWCAETRAYQFPGCATAQCYVGYNQPGACNPRDTNNTPCNP